VLDGLLPVGVQDGGGEAVFAGVGHGGEAGKEVSEL
jgi:hypothetical protein